MKPDQVNKPTFDVSDLGCYFDCARGIYIGVAVQQLALDKGWPVDTGDTATIPLAPDDEFYHELIDEAIEHLQSLTINGLWWGYSESADFGLWLTSCDECEGQGERPLITPKGIENPFLKTECLSCRGTGNELQIKV